ncbi:SGNH/GDSL hydrolase family protein [Gordonia amarae]|uniref:SGNH hydrolase-type esterase domain-containing protein n=2 Tax=Gordonia amarae TaxID=36821 RepID=G7GNW3_9ACTN|nr:SGNH/GDSL hydrolase family protein [Gordonia amarae]MCS3878124.1 lysophospholipase L1-like esterase [Gordonia amarae]QHN16800.1 SGNH/GDSL hydrolase family protein [Gordonia amarae]QHN21325.1 SGNH/GDSL hydrolase family protein [Gordonia amarae]QHN30180.1 SGNH/GDSL hydrolase family protein [Gordonia amarae]QHN38953.1 SGNH/GDSL hydrolase family protein [Gordonia amarae]
MPGSFPLSDRAVRDGGAALAAAAATATASWAAYRGVYTYLNGQAEHARTVIPRPTDGAPNGDGVYYPDGTGPVWYRRGLDFNIHLVVFGDSTGAGLGAEVADETPGVLLARMVADHTGQVVRYSNKAIVGATSKGLAGQIDAMLVAGDRPHVAVIIIGANDVTATNGIRASAQRLGAAVRFLVDNDAKVVVATCPDFGVITAIPQPLRTVLRRYGLRLASAQRGAVRSAGGRAVPMADMLAKSFREQPDSMLSPDHYHPSATGYALAADILLPEVLAAIGEWGPEPLPEPPEVSEAAERRKPVNRLRRLFT